MSEDNKKEEKPEKGVAESSEAVNTPEVAEEEVTLSKERPTVGDVPTSTTPMLIKRIQKNEDGGLDCIFSLSQLQTYILLNFAIAALLSQGLAQIVDIPEEQKEEEGITLGERLH